MELTCPNCEKQISGHQIIGYEVRGVYDGVLFWICQCCGHAFPRDFGDWAKLNDSAKYYAEEYNASLKEEEK